MTYKTISVIGLGYIGLPTATVFASRKIKVVGVDTNLQTVETINRGAAHIVEPDLDMLVGAAVTERYLRATTQVEPADAFLIAVPTPFNKTTLKPDLSYIQAAAQSIAEVLAPGNLIVLESTSPVGTTEQLAQWLAELRPDLTYPHTHGENSDIRIAYCPERVMPGHVLYELVHNDRVVGGLTAECSKAACSLYKIFLKGECVLTSVRTAEMVKLTENSFRDVNIAFANELSMICDTLDINVWELIALANRHPRVNILQPGPGVGGHCIAVDPWFVISKTPQQARLIRAARKVNDSKPQWVVNQVKQAVADYLQANPDKTVKNITIACYGLAFKADIDDLRESPALQIAEQITAMHAGTTLVVEPHIQCLPAWYSGELNLVSQRQAALQADIAVLLVDHQQFKDQQPNRAQVVDTRGAW